jgi:hypothetical protein
MKHSNLYLWLVLPSGGWQSLIWLKLKVWVQKIFRPLPSKLVKDLNKSWLKFHPFYTNKNKCNEVEGSFVLKKFLFLPTRTNLTKKNAESFAKLSWIFQSFPGLDDILWYLMNL